MNPVSVLAVVNRFPAPSETFIARKLSGLKQAGFDVTVAASAFSAGADDLELGMVSTTPWRRPASRPSRNAIVGVASSIRLHMAGPDGHASLQWRRRMLAAPLAAVGADIVHFEFSGIAVSYLDLLDQLRPAKLVVSCRGAAEQILPLSDPERSTALAQVFSRVDLIHCVSEDMSATVVGLGAPPEKILVNRPAVPVDSFAFLRDYRAVHDGPLRVASVGRLHWKKGLDDGLRAIAGLIERGHKVDYRVAGEGPEREKLTFLAHQLGIAPSVRLEGMRTTAQVRELLRWADILLLPSLSEGISNAALEAMAAGVAVVSTSCGGMQEVIESGKSGFVVPVGQPEALLASLLRLAEDPELRARMGAAAADRALQESDLARQISTFASAYKRLAAQ